MKKLLKPILKRYLKCITKLTLLIHRPKIIAIAGSTNKNFVKQTIRSELLELGVSVRVNPKNFNTEIGLPLSILYLPSGYNEYKQWLPAILKAPAQIFKTDFHEYLVLNLGTSDEGDMKYLLSIVKPYISVITDITQRYKEGFSDMDSLVKEYELLAKKTNPKGLLLLNADNARVKNISSQSAASVVFYGSGKDCDPRIVEQHQNKKGQEVTIDHQGEKHQFQINKFGQHHIYASMIGLVIKKYFSQNYEQKTSS